MKTLDDYQAEIGQWGDATFPKTSAGRILAHLEEEIRELIEASDFLGDPDDDMAEAADCLLLLLHYAHRRRFSLFAAAEEKMAINRARTWKSEPEPAGHFKHETAGGS